MDIQEVVEGACRNELQHGFEQNIPKIIEGVTASIKHELQILPRGETGPRSEQIDQEHQQEIKVLNAKNKSLEEKVARLTEEVERTQQLAARAMKEADRKAKDTAIKLHKIILDSGLSEAGPTDDEVEKAFSRLYHAIFQFVMKHCQHHASRKGVYGELKSFEAKNLWVVSFIANRIYLELFSPEVKGFGFGPETDRQLAVLEKGLLRIERVPLLDVTEWRVKTCHLSALFDPQGQCNVDTCQDQASDLYKKLAPFWHHEPPELKRKAIEIKPALEDIYQQAFRISMLFRRSKVEYRWLQMDRHEFSRSLRVEDVEEVATAGFENYEQAAQAHGDFKTVFGEVVKANSASGRVADGSQLLRKCLVLLGPIPAL